MFLAKYNFFNDYTISLFKSYHFSILFFNMLPIINLDGFKILNIILNSDSHPDANYIYNLVKQEMPNISLGTVYRNLNTLSNKGKIRKIILFPMK